MADNRGYKRLDMSKLKNRNHKYVATEESLRDVILIQWSDDVLQGKKGDNLLIKNKSVIASELGSDILSFPINLLNIGC